MGFQLLVHIGLVLRTNVVVAWDGAEPVPVQELSCARELDALHEKKQSKRSYLFLEEYVPFFTVLIFGKSRHMFRFNTHLSRCD